MTVIHNNPVLESKVRWVRICIWLVILLHSAVFFEIYLVLSQSPLGEIGSRYLVGGYLAASIIGGFIWAYGFAKPFAGKVLIRSDEYVEDTQFPIDALFREVSLAGGNLGRYSLYVTVGRGLGKNAYATSIGRNIGITHQMMEFMTDADHRRGLIAHEAGHLEARDTLSMVLITATTLGLKILSLFLVFSAVVFGCLTLLQEGLSADISMSKMALFIGAVFFLYQRFPLRYINAYISRQQEYAADLYAAALGYGDMLEGAMRKLYEAGRADLLADMLRQYYPGYRIPTNDLEPFKHPLSSHPPVGKRIHIMRRIKSQGWVPDKWEWFIGSGIWLLAGTVAYMLRHQLQLPPLNYLLVLCWMNILHTLLGMGVDPGAQTLFDKWWYLAKVIAGAVLGFVAIKSMSTVPVLGAYWQYLAGVWLITPLFWFSAEWRLDVLEPLSEFCVMVLMLAGALALAVMLGFYPL